MYNYSYEDYMNNLLGYNINTRNNMYSIPMNIEPNEDENAYIEINETKKNELEECYPEIYKIVYPMICKSCLYVTEEITPELVEKITNEIYENLETDEAPQEKRGAEVKINYSNIRNNRNIGQYNRNINENTEKEEKRQRNFFLNDLIKILVLRELIGQGNRPPRPFPPNRPPMPRNNENIDRLKF